MKRAHITYVYFYGTDIFWWRTRDKLLILYVPLKCFIGHSVITWFLQVMWMAFVRLSFANEPNSKRNRDKGSEKRKEKFIATPSHQSGNPSRTVTSNKRMYKYIRLNDGMCTLWRLVVHGLRSSDKFNGQNKFNDNIVRFTMYCNKGNLLSQLVDDRETLSYIDENYTFYSFKLTWSIAVNVDHESW